jgi:hypothetical protein
MEREILFKAKIFDGKGWIEGDVYHGLNDWIYINTVIQTSIVSRENKLIRVIPLSVCQFIDYEDNEGIKTFEGDKVIIRYAGKTREGVVIYDDRTNAFVVAINDSKVKVSFQIIDSLLVTGNIHD